MKPKNLYFLVKAKQKKLKITEKRKEVALCL
jgi:hypothetical protein